MEDINIILSTAIDRYFESLGVLGFSSQANTDNLVVLSGISYIINNFQDNLTEDDIRALYKAVLCISGNCLIDYSKELSEDSLIHPINTNLKYRASEDTILRQSEDLNTRSTEYLIH